jgi:hypothetical protein
MLFSRIVRALAALAVFATWVGSAAGQGAGDVEFDAGIAITVNEQAAYLGYALFGDGSACDTASGDPEVSFSQSLADYASARGLANAATGLLRSESIAEGTTVEHGPGFASNFVCFYQAFQIDPGTSGKSEGDDVNVTLTFHFAGRLEATNAVAGVYGGVGLFRSFDVNGDWELVDEPVAWAHAGGILTHGGIFSSLFSLEDTSDASDLPDPAFAGGDTDAEWSISGATVSGTAQVGEEVLLVGFLGTACFGGVNGASCEFHDTATGGLSTDDGTELTGTGAEFHVVPEPATAALFALGAAALHLAARRPRAKDR